MGTAPKLSYTLDEAAKATSLARSRIYQAIAAKELVTFKAGRRRMVSVAALQNYIASLEQATSAGGR